MAKKKPLISFVIPMKEQDFRVIALINSIRRQNYPQNKIELIIIDGGSNPNVLIECQKLGAKIYNNPKQLAEGAGMGKDQGIWKSKGKYVVIAESDIELMDDNWINKMIKPLEENEDIFASVPRLFVHPKDNITNRYLSYVGTDPFAVYRSIEGQLELNSNLYKTQYKGYYIMELDKKKPFCMGSNGFMFRRELIKKVGDYERDVEFIAKLAKNDYVKFAVLEDARVWHKNVKNFWGFIKKRIKWTRIYTNISVNEKRDFIWVTNKLKFYTYILKNLIIIPNLIIGISKALKTRDRAWLLHPILMFFSTSLNIFYSLTSRKMLKQIFS
jgi:glycosyltransferase involved in cell wall biosynthesis